MQAFAKPFGVGPVGYVAAMPLREAADRYPLTTSIIGIGLGFFAFLVVMHGVNKELFGDGYVFALDSDQSISAWATSAMFALAGLGAGLLAWLRPEDRPLLAVLSVVTTALSAEQVVQLHGHVEEEIANPGSTLIEATIGIAVVIVIVLAARALARPYNYLLLGSIGALVLASLASKANQEGDIPYAAVIFLQTVEEISEMLVALLIIAALAEPVLRDFERRVRGNPEPASG